MKKTLLFISALITFYANSQTFPVGHMSINFKDASRTGGFAISGGLQMPGTGRDIGTEIYYPGATAGNSVAVATGTFPIVVIGHGFQMSWDSYDNIYNALASKGYIVALPRTEGSLSPSHSNFGDDLRLLTTLMQSLNTTTVVALTTFNGKINNKTAIGGHSMGGGCSFLSAANNTTLTCLFNLAAANSNTTGVSSIQSASLISATSLIIGGQRDCVADTTANQNPMYNGIASTKKFKVILKDLTHCDFGNGTSFPCTLGQGVSGCGNTISNSLALNRYMTYLEPFLANQLKDNCSEGNRFMDSINSVSSNRSGRRILGTLACTTSTTSTSISEQTNLQSFVTFPNPANDVLTINYKSEASIPVTFQLFDIAGKMVYQTIENTSTTSQHNKEINISNLDLGCYILFINKKEFKGAYKIIKQ